MRVFSVIGNNILCRKARNGLKRYSVLESSAKKILRTGVEE